MIDALDGLAGVGEGEKIEPAVFRQVHGREDRFRDHRRQGSKFPPFIAQPDAAAVRAGDDQIHSAVVVQVRDQKPERACFPVLGELRPANQIGNLPGDSVVRELLHHTVVSKGEQIDVAVVVHVGRR